MKAQLQLVGVLLRKDIRLFWHFSLLNAALIMLWQFPTVVSQFGALAQLGQVALLLANVMLILAVFHEDAMVSLKHDWLTRPVPGLALLAAKCLFVVLAFVVPALVGAIANSLYQGHSVAESLARGVAIGAGGSVITFNLLVMAFAAVTANARQALVVFLAGIVSFFIMAWITNRILGLGGAGFLGSGWVIGTTMQIALVLVALAVLWLQYGIRHTRAPRQIVGIAIVAGWTFILLMTGPRMFALQKALSPDPAAGASIEIASGKGCFPARMRNESPAEVAQLAVASGSMIVMPSGRGGESAIAFSTQSVQQGVPAGDRLTAGRVRLTYLSAGQTQDSRHSLQALRLQTYTDGSLLEPSQNWLLPRSIYDRLAQSAGIETQIDYSLSLLAPKATAEFLADGHRAYYS